ncbi:hypothetical protein PG996_012227 [Apiospora saccharicola]|uniref:Nudix hydrolase domain-containing protein n=1 Tax=Apiospora saccharicola TaxID=335842 RepID=A0ABR1U413_9PEZI
MASCQPNTAADAAAGATSSLKRREVAASFLFRFAPGDDDGAKKKGQVQVALFRRSGEVRTYQHKLAPVSGSVDEDDADALATAVREIKEETTLGLGSDIELLRKGKPYSFADESIGREWTIHPFAFRLKPAAEGGKGEAGIVIGWEHEGWEWHDPLLVEDSEEFGGVPRLLESLRRVWPEIDLGAEAGAALTDGLRDLQTDHESGARQLAAKAVSILRDVISAAHKPSNHDYAGPLDYNNAWWATIRMASWHLWENGRESMGAAIVSALVSVLDLVEQAALTTGGPPNERLLRTYQTIETYLARRESAVAEISASFVDFVKDRVLAEGRPEAGLKVLTLSSSSTIASCLAQAATALDGVVIDLRILESRPLCEGVTLASKLLSEADSHEKTKKRIDIRIYSDASAALASEDVDLVLLGADRISAAGDVSNKTGSLPAVLSAKHVSPGARVLILSEVDKIAGPGEASEHVVEENDANELTRGWLSMDVRGAKNLVEAASSGINSAKVKVKNVYFEWVPARFIDAYITDEGVWSADKIRERSDWVGAKIDHFFGDL